MQSDNLLSLKDDMVAFIAGHGMRRFHGYVSEEIPSVMFDEESPDAWKDFVEHAKSAGAPFVIMSEVVLEKQDVALLLDRFRNRELAAGDMDDLEDAERLVKHVGKLGLIQLGFAHQGVVFLFEAATEWYDRFQTLLDSLTDFGDMILDERDTDE